MVAPRMDVRTVIRIVEWALANDLTIIPLALSHDREMIRLHMRTTAHHVRDVEGLDMESKIAVASLCKTSMKPDTPICDFAVSFFFLSQRVG